MSSSLAVAKASLRNFHSFRGVGRETILCRLVFFGDLWRDKKEHLVLASLRNGDFEKLCKIQLGILTCCCLRALWVRRLSDDHHLVQCVFCFLFLTSTRGIRYFWISGQSYVSPTQLTAFVSNPSAKMKRKKPPQSPL